MFGGSEVHKTGLVKIENLYVHTMGSRNVVTSTGFDILFPHFECLAAPQKAAQVALLAVPRLLAVSAPHVAVLGSK